MPLVSLHRFLLQGALVFCGSVAVVAQQVAAGSVGMTPVQDVHSSVSIHGGGGISLFGYILTILVLGVAAASLLFKGGALGFLGKTVKGPKKLQIEETRPLGHRQYLVVAEYEGRRLLLGVCPGRIDYLCGLDQEGGAVTAGFSQFMPREGEKEELGGSK